jgi:hypothetical protein
MDRACILRGANEASSGSQHGANAFWQGALMIISSYRRIAPYFIEVTSFFE